MKTVRLILHGDIQGVGYRWFAQRTAERYNIKGHVQNLSDGTVEIIAQGENLAQFLEQMKQGPRFAHVERVEEETCDEEEFLSFGRD